MSDSKLAQQPIIIKRKAGHGGHHGGAWKVAYADFVTAMMALFIVLWLLSSSEKVKKAVAGYFQDPSGKAKFAGNSATGDAKKSVFKDEGLEKLKEKIEKALERAPDIKKLKEFITITITQEGLRVELSENKDGVFFQSGSSQPTKVLEEVLTILAGELGKLPNTILVEGHTDATPYEEASGYSNWELSSDRANAARRLVQHSGVRANQIKQVRGFADQSLRNTQNPRDASNRRISFLIQNADQGPNAPPTPLDGHKPGGTRNTLQIGEVQPVPVHLPVAAAKHSASDKVVQDAKAADVAKVKHS